MVNHVLLLCRGDSVLDVQTAIAVVPDHFSSQQHKKFQIECLNFNKQYLVVFLAQSFKNVQNLTPENCSDDRTDDENRLNHIQQTRINK
jgi:hypothetical protein